MDLNRRIREVEDLAWITESLQLGGGRVDFALIIGAVGLGIVMAQHAPVLLLLLLCTVGLAWSFSGRAQLATRSWLQDLVDNWSQPAPAEPAEAFEVGSLREAANLVSDLYTQWPSRSGAGQSRRVAELNERPSAHPERSDALTRKTQIAIKRERDAIEVALRDFAVEERDALIRKTQIAIMGERDAIEVALRDFAVLERNQGNRLH